jgi:probable rRNA maturation factor
MNTIKFHNNLSINELKNRKKLKEFLPKLCKAEGKKIDNISFVFCSDTDLLEINREFLQHDTFTDIISFDYSEQPGIIKGEIYISVDRVRENARDIGTSFQEEIHRVVFHGVLHFCGYKDKLNEEVLQIRAKEDFYLRKYLG